MDGDRFIGIVIIQNNLVLVVWYPDGGRLSSNSPFGGILPHCRSPLTRLLAWLIFPVLSRSFSTLRDQFTGLLLHPIALSLVSVIVIQQIRKCLKGLTGRIRKGIAEKDLVVRRGSEGAWKKARKVLIFHPSQVAWPILEPYLALKPWKHFEGSLDLTLPCEEGQRASSPIVKGLTASVFGGAT